MTRSDPRSGADAELDNGRWVEAAARFAALAAETGDPAAHEGLAQAAWWLDDAETVLREHEAAYRIYRAAGQDRAAARVASSLGYDSMLFGKGVAVGRGWLARAGDLLVGCPDAPEAGWLAVREAEVALNVDHDAAAALAAATRAHQIGRGTGHGDLEIVGQALTGLARVRSGDVQGGTTLLDAAVAAATAGDVENLMWVGKICCWLISACQETHDLARAGDWCERVTAMCVDQGLEPLFAVCRTQYASVLLAGGQPKAAESALLDVLARLDSSARLSRYDAVAQLGEVRRRQGRLTEAEALLKQAGYRPAAITSLAHLRLDQDDPERAWATITELLRSMSPDQLLERVGALAVAVAAGLAAGHLPEAREAADDLGRIADQVATTALRAHANAARARLSEPAASIACWQDAVRGFRDAGLTFDEADARLELAAALRSAGREAEAAEQAAAGLAALAPLHDRPLTDGPLTVRQIEVLRLLATGLSNSEIARCLHISDHTVHRHIANIYSALGVTSRAAAATYAATHGLT